MKELKCELCGSPVKVVGKTTLHYEPIKPAEDKGLEDLISDNLQTDCIATLLEITSDFKEENYNAAANYLANAITSAGYKIPVVDEEHQIRMKYQNIVYQICQLFDTTEEKCTTDIVVDKVRHLAQALTKAQRDKLKGQPYC